MFGEIDYKKERVKKRKRIRPLLRRIWGVLRVILFVILFTSLEIVIILWLSE